MSSRGALKQYQNVSTYSQVFEASPHRLIQMLMESCMSRLLQARGAMEHDQVASRGELIGKAIAIIGGLRESLNLEAGGELAANLDSLYDYMISRLLVANLHADVQCVDEVIGLLGNVKSAWDAIGS